MPDTPPEELDRALSELDAAKERWTQVGIEARIDLLKSCMRDLGVVAADWVGAARRIKGLPAGSNGEGQEWLVGPMAVMRNLRLLAEALAAGGQPRPPKLEPRGDRWVARVVPASLFEKLMFSGMTAEIWLDPAREPTQGRIYRERKPGPGGVSLVLGAGNQTSIGPMDALQKLFVDDEVVILKMNPVNELTGPCVEKAFATLVAGGFLRVVYGGADVGKRLVEDPRIASIHITGSARTHDAIVWGADPIEQARRKQSGERLFTREITSELGCVTPIVVVPGAWSEAGLDFQARHVAAMMTHNAGFNCTAAQVLVLSEGWPQRATFLDRVRRALEGQPPNPSYYPGADTRKDAFVKRYPAATAHGPRENQSLPWLVIPTTPDGDGYLFEEESFCGVLGAVTLAESEPARFLEAASAFCNDRLWGTLSCALLIDPETERRARTALDDALAALRYGTIGVNLWGGVGYGLVTPPWGAYPGHPLEDIGSGRGFVHNTFLFDHPEKTVLRGPFIIKPTPGWFTDHRNLARLGKKALRFEEGPGWGSFFGAAFEGLRG